MRTVVVSTCAALLTCAAALAQDWPKEPDSVLGARLGVPLAEIGLPDCATKPSGPCLSTRPSPLPGYPLLRTIQQHPFPYATFAVEVDDHGTVTQVVARLKQESFGRFHDVLRERYGPPTAPAETAVQSRAGATYPSREDAWVGKLVTITALERAESIDWSVVAFSSNAFLQQREQAKRTSDKGAASAL